MNSKPADGLGTQVRRLLELLDGDVEAVYREMLPGYLPRYTPVMKALAGGESQSIKTIAAQSSISHSAASQTIARMSEEGLVTTAPDSDRRNRLVSLTPAGKRLLPRLREVWRGADRAAASLDRALPHPLSRLLGAAIEELEGRPFRSRMEHAMKDKKS